MGDKIGEPVGESSLMFLLRTLGLNGLLVALVALIAFVLTLAVVRRGKGTTAAVALVFIVPLPVLVSILCELKGVAGSFSVIVTTNVEVTASEVFVATLGSLLTLFVGMLLTVPSYLLTMLFLFRRSLEVDSSRQASNET